MKHMVDSAIEHGVTVKPRYLYARIKFDEYHPDSIRIFLGYVTDEAKRSLDAWFIQDNRNGLTYHKKLPVMESSAYIYIIDQASSYKEHISVCLSRYARINEFSVYMDTCNAMKLAIGQGLVFI